MLKKLLQPKLWLTLSLISLSACANGPKVTVCIANVKSANFSCFNEANHKSSSFTKQNVDGFICLNASDEASVLNACSQRLGAVKVKVCVYEFDQDLYSCFNEVNSVASTLPFAKSDGFICSSAVDTQLLLNYCESLK